MKNTLKQQSRHRASRKCAATGIAALLLLVAHPARAAELGEGAEVKAIRVVAQPGFRRVIVSLDAPVQYNSARLVNPDRLYFDLLETRAVRLAAPPIAGDDAFLSKVRVGQPKPDVTRIVLDLKGAVDYRTFFMTDPPRFVVELTRPGESPSGDMAVTSNSVAMPVATPRAPKDAALAPPSNAGQQAAPVGAEPPATTKPQAPETIASTVKEAVPEPPRNVEPHDSPVAAAEPPVTRTPDAAETETSTAQGEGDQLAKATASEPAASSKPAEDLLAAPPAGVAANQAAPAAPAAPERPVVQLGSGDWAAARLARVVPPPSPSAPASASSGPPIESVKPPLPNIVVLEGEGAFNDIKRKIGRDPMVAVRDQRDRPIRGAQVTFTLPASGPSATFDGGSRTFTTTSDEDGRASTKGLKPNETEGRFNMKVTASYRGQETSIVITQSNTLAGGAVFVGQGKSHKKKWILIAVVAGGATGGIIAATHGGGSSSPAVVGPAPTVLSSGGITVGGPH